MLNAMMFDQSRFNVDDLEFTLIQFRLNIVCPQGILHNSDCSYDKTCHAGLKIFFLNLKAII